MHDFLSADPGSVWCFNPKNNEASCLVIREDTHAPYYHTNLFSINSDRNIIMKLGIREASNLPDFFYEKVLWADDLNEHRFGWIPEGDAVDCLEPFFLSRKSKWFKNSL